MLSDNVLLEIFDFYRTYNHVHSLGVVWKWNWHVLAHVCQRWRQIVFSSPQRLKLQILCKRGTPVRKNLGIWPPFPIALSMSRITPYEDAIAALEHPDRVCFVRFYATGFQLGKLVTVMQKPFPMLSSLSIVSDRTALVLPAEFLGGSAPCLRVINLNGIPYPALPTLLSSTSDLVTLHLRDIPSTGYILPETMAACLARLPRLEDYIIDFHRATPRLDRICPPPATRIILPALTSFQFHGYSEYLEELVARIDIPRANQIQIFYLNRLVDFQVPQLSEFIDRSMGLRLTPSRSAHVSFCRERVTFTLHRHANCQGWDPVESLGTTVSFQAIRWQVSHMAQVLSQFFATLFTVVHLETQFKEDDEVEGRDDVEWLHLFHQFPAVRMLRVTSELAGFAALALGGIRRELVADLLPSLELICFEGQPASSVEKFEFVATRRLSGRSVTVVDTRKEFYERLESLIPVA